jgi:predicted nucleic acid-binding Zn ribbon protein
MIDKPIRKCPECGGFSERLITGGGGILFKGEGFYCTDYRSETYKEAARKESSMEGGGQSKADTSESGKKREGSD